MLQKILVSNFLINIIIIFILVLAVAGNKSDMYEYEEVEEKEGMAFAKNQM